MIQDPMAQQGPESALTGLQAPPPIQSPGILTQENYGLPIEKKDREDLAKAYSDEILRALGQRRSSSSGFQWTANDAGTAATRTEGGPAYRIKGFEEDLEDFWARYELIPPARELPFEGAANYRVPLTKWAIDAIHARLLAGLIGVRPYWEVEPTEPAYSEDASELEDFCDWVAEHEINFVEWLDDAILNSEVEGTAVGFLTWEKREEHKLVETEELLEEEIFDEFMEPITDQTTGIPITKQFTQTTVQEKDDVVYEGPRLDLVPLVDFLLGDHRRKSLLDQPWLGHRARLYRPELEALKDRDGYFAEEIDEVLQSQGNQYTETRPIAEQGVADRTGINDQTPANVKMLQWYEIWSLIGWYDYDLDGKPERVVMEIAMPQKRLIRLIRYPFKHGRPNYILVRLQPRSKSAYGRSLAADLRMTQDEIDAVHNQRTDATSVAIASLFMFLYDDQVSFDASRNKISLGESIRVEGDINHLQVLAKAFRGVTPPGMDIEQMLLSFAERISGISDPQAGRPAEGRKTAFEIASVIQEGNVRFRRMIERASVAVNEVFYQTMELYAQFGRHLPRVQKVLSKANDPFKALSAGRFHYRVHGAAIASNQDLDARRALELLQLAEQSPIVSTFVKQNPLRAYKLARMVLQKAGGSDVDVDSIIGSEAELIQFLKAMAAAKATPANEAPPEEQPAPGAVDPAVDQFVQERLGGGAPTPPTPEEMVARGPR